MDYLWSTGSNLAETRVDTLLFGSPMKLGVGKQSSALDSVSAMKLPTLFNACPIIRMLLLGNVATTSRIPPSSFVTLHEENIITALYYNWQ